MQLAAQSFPLALAFAAPQLESVRYPVSATSLLLPPDGSDTAACVLAFLSLSLSQAAATVRATSAIMAKTVTSFFISKPPSRLGVVPLTLVARVAAPSGSRVADLEAPILGS